MRTLVDKQVHHQIEFVYHMMDNRVVYEFRVFIVGCHPHLTCLHQQLNIEVALFNFLID
jgi:hypothetical protein